MKPQKKAEDGDDMIVRLCEEFNEHTRRTLTFGFELASVWLCDMMENEIQSLPTDGRCVSVSMKPFEIVTLKVKKAEKS